jgi:hypothetical protein
METMQDIIVQFNALRTIATKKRVAINMGYTQREGHYFTAHDSQTGDPIGRYTSITELEDAVTNWVDDPNKDIPGWESYVPEVKVPLLGKDTAK